MRCQESVDHIQTLQDQLQDLIDADVLIKVEGTYTLASVFFPIGRASLVFILRDITRFTVLLPRLVQ